MEPSLLDRLTDSDPKTSLRRDLAALLNSRRQERDFDAEFEHASESVLTFGLADFTAYNLNSSIDQERVRCAMERAIRQFEPRLTRIAVTLTQPEPFHPLLTLRIEAELQNGERAEDVRIEGAIDRASRRIVLHGAAA